MTRKRKETRSKFSLGVIKRTKDVLVWTLLKEQNQIMSPPPRKGVQHKESEAEGEVGVAAGAKVVAGGDHQ